jgi:hypothetical protein
MDEEELNQELRNFAERTPPELPKIALPGGRVRHPELRPTEAPTPASESDREESQ